MNWNFIFRVAIFVGIAYFLMRLFRLSVSVGGGGCCEGPKGIKEGGKAHQ